MPCHSSCLAWCLIYVFAFRLRIFPSLGGYTAGTFPALTPVFLRDALYHSILPALSIILVSIGGWALGMRAMMITTQGEDFVTYADAKGLKGRTIFFRYAIRNALLPQATALALVLGQLVSGAVLVEVVFSYPGIGTVLYAGDPRRGFLRRAGDRLHPDRLHRSRDPHPRSHLSTARSSHHLSEGVG